MGGGDYLPYREDEVLKNANRIIMECEEQVSKGLTSRSDADKRIKAVRKIVQFLTEECPNS